jgi:hypothetical protein
MVVGALVVMLVMREGQSTGDRRPETADRQPETEETGDRRQATGEWRQAMPEPEPPEIDLGEPVKVVRVASKPAARAAPRKVKKAPVVKPEPVKEDPFAQVQTPALF